MVGVLLVAHGEIAESFLAAARKILGEVAGVRTVSLAVPLDEGRILQDIHKARKEVDQGQGILVLTDMFGGTPANLCFSLLEDDRVEVLTGMNLPMILQILSSREGADLPELSRMAMECGRENIHLGRVLLEAKARRRDAGQGKRKTRGHV